MKKSIVMIVAIICCGIVLSIGCKKKTDDPDSNLISSALNPISSIVVSINDTYITLSWEKPAEGTPSAYKVYRNDILIQSLTETTFSEIVSEIGIYNYCVSAVYAEGESEKECIIAEVTDISSDNADIIKGQYVGTISLPLSQEVFENKTIDLVYKSMNFVTVSMNDSITTSGITVPLHLNEDVYVHYNDSTVSFQFSFETESTIVIQGQAFTFPLSGTGEVNESEIPELTLNIVVQTGIFGDISGVYVGYRQ
ncbi:MAG: fibronectin type III domain-containing protein [Bacteroidales bacterium]|nr:fibronectin type III domain-containing protein [Bacteroidales bacterium]